MHLHIQPSAYKFLATVHHISTRLLHIVRQFVFPTHPLKPIPCCRSYEHVEINMFQTASKDIHEQRLQHVSIRECHILSMSRLERQGYIYIYRPFTLHFTLLNFGMSTCHFGLHGSGSIPTKPQVDGWTSQLLDGSLTTWGYRVFPIWKTGTHVYYYTINRQHLRVQHEQCWVLTNAHPGVAVGRQMAMWPTFLLSLAIHGLTLAAGCLE